MKQYGVGYIMVIYHHIYDEQEMQVQNRHKYYPKSWAFLPPICRSNQFLDDYGIMYRPHIKHAENA